MDGSIIFARWRQCALRLIQSSPHPKRHLNRFSGFCKAHDRDRPTDRRTDHATLSVTIGRIYVSSTAMRPEDYMKTMVIEKVEYKVMHNCGYLRKINRNLMKDDTIDDNLSKVINYFSVFMFSSGYGGNGKRVCIHVKYF